MTAQELEVIHADLLVAKNILYPPDGGNHSQNNPQLNNLAAYLSAQAIEKALKNLVHDKGEMNAELSVTHNIASLLISVELYNPNFIRNHEFVTQNAKSLSKANSLRYGKKGIDKGDAIAIYKAARDLHCELQQEYLSENPDKRQMFNEAVRQYDAMEKLPFKRQEAIRD